MLPAAEAMAPIIAAADVADPSTPVIGNVAAEALTTADEVRADLTAQIRRPVRWRDTVLKMQEMGVERYGRNGSGQGADGAGADDAATTQAADFADIGQYQ